MLADSNDAFPPIPQRPASGLPGPRNRRARVAGRAFGAVQPPGGIRDLQRHRLRVHHPGHLAVLPGRGGFGAAGVYQHPGGYTAKAQGDSLTKQRIDGLRSQETRLIGESDCRWLVPGHWFTLSGHDDDSLNIDWVLTSVTHDASHAHYRNRFEAIPAATAYRPARVTPKPRMHTQTALVVGKAGEEIWTDQYGRIKLQFPWDRDGKNDETSSCWVRVVLPWSGKGFGMQFVPRIGQEVIVTFIDGDPDRPLVTGCVYNGDNALLLRAAGQPDAVRDQDQLVEGRRRFQRAALRGQEGRRGSLPPGAEGPQRQRAPTTAPPASATTRP
ncbi:type VI secretion system tip protein VgrG [Pseudomonas aeruginosa]|nr:type VI secretion system tip protein VgrG [Pseudomonas aeruginosa]